MTRHTPTTTDRCRRNATNRGVHDTKSCSPYDSTHPMSSDYQRLGGGSWSSATVAAFIVMNAAFAAYLWLGIPRLCAPNPGLAHALMGYISLLGASQLFECLMTGQGTNYGKFGAEGGGGAGSWYQRIMDAAAKPTLPIGLAWWTMEQPSLLVPLVFLAITASAGPLDAGAVFLGLARRCRETFPHDSSAARALDAHLRLAIGLFCLHYLQRAFVYPWLTRGRPYPILYWALALVFTSVNGTLQSLELLFGGYYSGMQDALSPCALAGSALFAFGMATNVHSDYILRNLRRPGETGYKIPKGGMFEYISGANLWGEVVEWLGFAIATRTPGAAVFSLFCLVGIGGRCVATHGWYLRKFGDAYPQQRRRMIPFVW